MGPELGWHAAAGAPSRGGNTREEGSAEAGPAGPRRQTAAALLRRRRPASAHTLPPTSCACACPSWRRRHSVALLPPAASAPAAAHRLDLRLSLCLLRELAARRRHGPPAPARRLLPHRAAVPGQGVWGVWGDSRVVRRVACLAALQPAAAGTPHPHSAPACPAPARRCAPPRSSGSAACPCPLCHWLPAACPCLFPATHIHHRPACARRCLGTPPPTLATWRRR